MLDYIVPILASIAIQNFVASTPQLSITPTEAFSDNVSIEVNGRKNSRVFVNGIEAGIIEADGNVIIALNTSGPDGIKNFEISLHDNANHVSKILSLSLEKTALSRKNAIKLLRQASYTSYEIDIDHVMQIGEMAWIDEQLAAKGAHDDLEDDYYGYMESVAAIRVNEDPYNFPPEILDDLSTMFPEHIKGSQSLDIFYHRVLLDKMFESKDQLKHRMALALNQIIVVSPSATAGSSLFWRPEGLIKLYDDLYEHSFGNYRDILKSACMSSAMSYFLTFNGNKKENTTTNTAPDENFARELMQLFSIGVYELNLDGTKILGTDDNPSPSYTQEDVSQLARVFTGWDWWTNVNDPRVQSWGNTYGNTVPNRFNLIHDNEFNSQWHEDGEKLVLGTTIPADLGGEEDIDAAIDILMNNPNMAPHVSRHLIMRLVTSNPTPGYIERVATAFNGGGPYGKGEKGDLKATVEAILKDDEARGVSEPEDFGKIDEFILAFSHYSSRFKVQALPFTYGGGVKKSIGYLYKWNKWVHHLPLGAPGVFNHYTNEDRPSDSYFSVNGLVAPELTTRIDNSLKDFMYITSSKSFDKYEEVDLNGTTLHHNAATTMEEWLDSYKPSVGLMYDSQDVYDQFLPLWWGPDKLTHEEAIAELVDILSIKLLGRELPDFYKQKIANQVAIRGNPIYMVRQVTRNIVGSPYFMVLD